ncbi:MULTISPECIES: fatty acid desaturase family protein [Microvirga]|uniref:Fatty acid desaturase n=1 Tax=Microvirga lotononidis TaxID=864069 RepID=I4Z4X5_9HYPH|nr:MULTISPECIES: fatty acid desaturase family protein [Microvirga]EIM31267.1 fatty acid desaturase [Microvirga lotononidis]WQO29993.1 fatty acid desaturase family protein [Microvirga lotononidis]
MIAQEAWPLRDARFESVSFPSDIKRALATLRTDNMTGALYIAKDYAVIVAFAALASQVSWWFYPLSVLFIGAHQRGLTTIAHDAAHKTLARNVKLNYFLGIVFAAYPLFQRHWAYRISHVHLHHPHLGDPEKDPDLKFFLESGVYDVRHPKKYLWDIVIFPLVGGATFGYLKYLFTYRFSVKNSDSGDVDKTGVLIDKWGFTVFWLAVFSACIAFSLLDELILFWIIPYLTTFQIIGWFTEIAEHSPMCEVEDTNLYLTRNRKGNFLERMLFGVNLDEYHLEHHLSPGIPFWLLKKAQEIRMADTEYRNVAATWSGLFCKGPKGQPSVISQLIDRNRRLYEAKRLTDHAVATIT